MSLLSDNLIPELVARTKKEPEEGGHLTVDVFQSANDIVVQSTIAGTDPNNIDISITKDMVTIQGRRDPEEKIKPPDYYHRELYWGPFSRSIILPADIDPNSAKASIKNGVLTIRLPRTERSSQGGR
ncbi:MAG: Hsp20/alpha crystallin family protein [Candidatus Yanofskybacteria bacterium]|nr:Hsp20/alpha crystallin family protein [Candidatus Yanofskybacteria bacterium]